MFRQDFNMPVTGLLRKKSPCYQYGTEPWVIFFQLVTDGQILPCTGTGRRADLCRTQCSVGGGRSSAWGKGVFSPLPGLSPSQPYGATSSSLPLPAPFHPTLPSSHPPQVPTLAELSWHGANLLGILHGICGSAQLHMLAQPLLLWHGCASQPCTLSGTTEKGWLNLCPDSTQSRFGNI